MKKIMLVLLLAQSVALGNTNCSEETIIEYIQLYSCRIGTSPGNCYLPEDLARLLAIGAGAVLGATKTPIKNGPLDKLINATAEKMGKRSALAKQQFEKSLAGTVSGGKFTALNRLIEKLKNTNIRPGSLAKGESEIVFGRGNNATEKGNFNNLINDFLEASYDSKLPKDAPLKRSQRILTPEAQEILRKIFIAGLDEISTAGLAKAKELDESSKENAGKSQQRWKSGLRGTARLGGGILGGLAGELAVTGTTELMDARAFQSCYKNYIGKTDEKRLREVVENRWGIANVIKGSADCEILVRPDFALAMLDNDTERLATAQNCPSCCEVIDQSLAQLRNKVKSELPQYDPEKTQCDAKEIKTSVTFNSRRYNYTLKRKADHSAAWDIQGSIASPSDFTFEDRELQDRINSFSIQLANDNYQLLKINNSNTAPYTLTAMDYEEALKRVLRFVDGDKGIVKTKADLSNSPPAIMGSVAEQLQALKYAVPAVQSFCESKAEATPENTPATNSVRPTGI